ncbi:MAG: ornithine carbamoyltransferase [Myxococcota bacterium]
MTRHFTRDLDISAAEQLEILELAAAMKSAPKDYRNRLDGLTLAMIFQKSSTRTRVSFETGIGQLGGRGIFLSSKDMQLGRGEPISDTGAVLSRYVDLIMIRTFAHSDVRDLAAASTVPVINGLDDTYHPCQILADLQTIREKKGGTKGVQLVYVGDGSNNMAHSLMLGGALAEMNVRVVAPDGYTPDPALVAEAAGLGTGHVEVTDSLDGVDGADVVVTDTWASMGQEEEHAKRLKAFAGYQVDDALMGRAAQDAIFMHCLPAHRGEEVSVSVIDGPQSVIYDEAENRLHAQKALMAWLVAQGS